jgi:purine-binding chemotaxis protein CheW
VPGNEETHAHVLIVRVGEIACALPIDHVVETMRPLPVEALGHAPGFVRGLAIIRGIATPVIDTARLLGTAGGPGTRFVVVRVGDRRVALAVDQVIDVRRFDRAELSAMPPLVRAADAGFVTAIGTTDAALLVMLEASRAIPHETWSAIEGADAR